MPKLGRTLNMQQGIEFQPRPIDRSNFLSEITRMNYYVQGSRTILNSIIYALIEKGLIDRSIIESIVSCVRGLNVSEKVGVRNELYTWQIFYRGDYFQASNELKTIFTPEEARDARIKFLGIVHSPFHSEMRDTFELILLESTMTEQDADYIILTFILADFSLSYPEA